MTRRKVRLLLVLTVFVGLPLMMAGCLWFGPSSSGEFRVSPDGKYEAYADNVSNGTILGRRNHYIVIRVVELSSGKELWRVVYDHAPDADVPDYVLRGLKFVVWAEDSSAVTIPVGDSRELKFPVP
ncbi:hypothetical protein [Limnoglobus roseus]|uniref:Uncharacterized protein n=1 Tax=Limnoglobus roseus TaxID=2598579 RepID=A0A5C1A500_9BACT|nr:hypothetical protein [Limnoglobus roseus]QEL13477.1 hypothetical protein PX52LOC_00334 [Limnoglobus roseus]